MLLSAHDQRLQVKVNEIAPALLEPSHGLGSRTPMHLVHVSNLKLNGEIFSAKSLSIRRRILIKNFLSVLYLQHPIEWLEDSPVDEQDHWMEQTLNAVGIDNSEDTYEDHDSDAYYGGIVSGNDYADPYDFSHYYAPDGLKHDRNRSVGPSDSYRPGLHNLIEPPTLSAAAAAAASAVTSRRRPLTLRSGKIPLPRPASVELPQSLHSYLSTVFDVDWSVGLPSTEDSLFTANAALGQSPMASASRLAPSVLGPNPASSLSSSFAAAPVQSSRSSAGGRTMSARVEPAPSESRHALDTLGRDGPGQQRAGGLRRGQGSSSTNTQDWQESMAQEQDHTLLQHRPCDRQARGEPAGQRLRSRVVRKPTVITSKRFPQPNTPRTESVQQQAEPQAAPIEAGLHPSLYPSTISVNNPFLAPTPSTTAPAQEQPTSWATVPTTRSTRYPKAQAMPVRSPRLGPIVPARAAETRASAPTGPTAFMATTTATTATYLSSGSCTKHDQRPYPYPTDQLQSWLGAPLDVVEPTTTTTTATTTKTTGPERPPRPISSSSQSSSFSSVSLSSSTTPSRPSSMSSTLTEYPPEKTGLGLDEPNGHDTLSPASAITPVFASVSMSASMSESLCAASPISPAASTRQPRSPPPPPYSQLPEPDCRSATMDPFSPITPFTETRPLPTIVPPTTEHLQPESASSKQQKLVEYQQYLERQKMFVRDEDSKSQNGSNTGSGFMRLLSRPSLSRKKPTSQPIISAPLPAMLMSTTPSMVSSRPATTLSSPILLNELVRDDPSPTPPSSKSAVKLFKGTLSSVRLKNTFSRSSPLPATPAVSAAPVPPNFAPWSTPSPLQSTSPLVSPPSPRPRPLVSDSIENTSIEAPVYPAYFPAYQCPISPAATHSSPTLTPSKYPCPSMGEAPTLSIAALSLGATSTKGWQD